MEKSARSDGSAVRIDAHQHFWKYSPAEYDWIGTGMEILARDFGPEDLLPSLRDRALHGCVAVQARRDERENDFLLGLADRHPFILGVVGWLDLESPLLDAKLDAFAGRNRVVGFREILQGRPKTEWFSEAFVRGVRRLGERGYAYDILIYSNQLADARELIGRCHPDQRLVIDHLAKPSIRTGEFSEWATGLRTLAREFPNLHCKLSGMVTEATPHTWTRPQLRPYMETVLDAFGADRVMYGSDWPVCLLAAHDYSVVHDVAADHVRTLGEAAATAVFGGNARRFYNLAR